MPQVCLTVQPNPVTDRCRRRTELKEIPHQGTTWYKEVARLGTSYLKEYSWVEGKELQFFKRYNDIVEWGAQPGLEDQSAEDGATQRVPRKQYGTSSSRPQRLAGNVLALCALIKKAECIQPELEPGKCLEDISKKTNGNLHAAGLTNTARAGGTPCGMDTLLCSQGTDTSRKQRQTSQMMCRVAPWLHSYSLSLLTLRCLKAKNAEYYA